MKKHQFLTYAALVAAAVLGWLLRLWQCNNARLADGRWDGGSVSVLVLGLFTALVLVGMILLARRLEKQVSYAALFPGGWYGGYGYLLGGVMLLAANVTGGLDLAGLLGIAAAIVTFVQGLQRCRGKQTDILLGCVLVIWLVVRIIGDFKTWSTDPAILDYCYQLFALLCAMMGGFCTAGFSAGVGKRRITAFWSMAGTYFCAMALADGGLTDGLLYGGLMLVSFQNALCMLGAAAKPASEE